MFHPRTLAPVFLLHGSPKHSSGGCGYTLCDVFRGSGMVTSPFDGTVRASLERGFVLATVTCADGGAVYLVEIPWRTSFVPALKDAEFVGGPEATYLPGRGWSYPVLCTQGTLGFRFVPESEGCVLCMTPPQILDLPTATARRKPFLPSGVRHASAPSLREVVSALSIMFTRSRI